MGLIIKCFGILPILVFLIVSAGLIVLTTPASAADVELEAYMGDTVTISGVSYVSDQMYLFLTGPGLDPNGVALTDISQKAANGMFTTLDVGSDQTWSFRWDTSRVSQSIDPGVYTIYATTKPVDLANLGGPGTYKTVEVWLKDSRHVSTGGSYTLNPEKSTSSPTPVPTLVFASPAPATSLTTAPPSPSPTANTSMPTTAAVTVLSTTTPARSPLPVAVALIATISGMAIALFFRKKSWERQG